MKKNLLNAPRTTLLATLGAGLTAAGLLLCGSVTQAQPTILAPTLPNAANGGLSIYNFAVGQVQLQGSYPLANLLTFSVSSSTSDGVTALSVTLTATNLPGQVGVASTTSILTPGAGLTV